MKRDNPKKIWKKIEESDNIITTLHSSPDGDSLGSCTAVKHAVEKETDNNVRIISFDQVSEDLQSFDYTEDVEFGTDIQDIDFEEYDLLIALDSPKPSRLGKYKDSYDLPDIDVINIDHHEANTFFGDLNYVDYDAPSTCSALIEIFKPTISFDKELSKRLYIGVATDTNLFQAFNNLSRALEEAGFLEKHGGDYKNQVLLPYHFNQSPRLKKYYGRILNKVEIDEENNIAISTLNYEDIQDLELSMSEIRKGPQQITGIKDTSIAVLLVETQELIKGSLRSWDGTDVSEIAATFEGGGGHKSSAGIYVEDKTMKEIKQQIIKEVQKRR